MKQIKILVPIHIMPDRVSGLTIFLDNVLPILKKQADVQIIWFVFQSKKEKHVEKKPGQIILQNADFNDALEVIEKIKPDIIYITPTYDLINFPFNLVSKKYKIPSFYHRISDTWRVRVPRNFAFRTKSYSKSFFERSLPTDEEDDEKQFMKRGKFFFKKYSFLRQTQKALGYSDLKILKTFFVIIKSLLFYSKVKLEFYPQFEFLENERLKQDLIVDRCSS